MSSPQTRQPAGVPTGGQFAASAHAESDVPLVSADRIEIDPAPPIPLSHLWDRTGEPLVGDRLLAAVVARTGLDRALGDGSGRWEDLRCFAAACRATGLDVTDEHARSVVTAVEQAETGAVHAGVAVGDGWRAAGRIVHRLAGPGSEMDGRALVEDPSWRPGNYHADTLPTDPHAADRLLAEHDQWQLRRARLHAEAEEGESDYEELDDLDFQMNWLSSELADQLRRTTRR